VFVVEDERLSFQFFGCCTFHLAAGNNDIMELRLREIFAEHGEFLEFLRTIGIVTVVGFVMADSESLASRWSMYKNCNTQHARDYVGAMKFHYYKKSSEM